MQTVSNLSKWHSKREAELEVMRRESEINILQDSITERIGKLALAIGPWQAAAEAAAMSSVMLEAYTKAGKPKAKPMARFGAFFKRIDGKSPRTGVHEIDALRRSLWRCVLKLADRIEPIPTMKQLVMRVDELIDTYREAGPMERGPEVIITDFFKRADGTSLI
ncbi:hypothetical protein MKK88_19370 [Methylobacterium sp. E-005]|uniref:hypothetical protein n=1 Tax=Methylobacterium sp. E-005 TaxID=2836549 RepID=UPI001FB8CCA9|nr:hypothetical protein [Methylobacterium sp. E-005]MCJ2088125.1 hypothetical protein [Methylobacterium sp. E-005]